MSELLQDMSLILISSMLLSVGFLLFGQPPLLGYILTGILVGPAFGQIIEDISIIKVLGEFGMILLLFLVGLELSLVEFKQVWVETLICLTAQVCGCLLIVFLFTASFGWSIPFSLFIAFNLSLSSTAVVVTLLENMNLLKSKTGSFAVSLLIAQDLSLMPMILILRALNNENSSSGSIINLFLALGILVFCVLHFGKTQTDNKKKLTYRSLLKRPEITTLIGGAFCFTCASLADLFKLSAAYGSFLAGLVLGNRWDRELLVQAFIPITSMMMMVFFISVGMRVSLDFMLYNFWPIIFVLALVTFAKILVNMIGLSLIKWPWRSAIFLATLLAQLSEFSFILIDEAANNSLINYYAMHFFIALTTLSLSFGSLLPLIVRFFQERKSHNDEH